MAFLGEVGAYIKDKSADEEMKPYVAPLGVAAGHLQQAAMWFMQNAMAKPDNAGAGSYDFMHLFGLVALGYMWARIAEAARQVAAEERRRLDHGRQARHRALLHGAHAAGDGDAPRAHPGGGGEHDGSAGRGFLIRSRRPPRNGSKTMTDIVSEPSEDEIVATRDFGRGAGGRGLRRARGGLYPAWPVHLSTCPG